MNNTLLVLLGVLLVVLMVMLIAFAILGVYIIIKKNPDLFSKANKGESLKSAEKKIDEMVAAGDHVPEVLEEHCKRHPEDRAHALCAICMDAFCEKCIIQEDNLNFCTEHFRIYSNNNWKPLEEIQTTPEKAEESEYLYHFKNQKWISQKVPMIITTHYQINVDQDQIESEVKLLVREQDDAHLREELKQIKNKH